MPRRQRLHTADAWDDLQAQCHTTLANQLQNAQGAVIQARLAPQQKGADIITAHFIGYQPGIQRRALAMPVLDRSHIVGRVSIALRVRHLYQAVAALRPVVFNNGLAQANQLVFVRTLIQ
ncbi:hypothetical protein D3C73_1231370 [compost metagenome]